MIDVRQKDLNQTNKGRLNIESIGNRFYFLESEATKHLDILLISETKIDKSFPMIQFLLGAFFRPYIIDHCANGGGILLYIKEEIFSCLLAEYKISDNTKCFFIDVNIRIKIWLLCYSYKPTKINMSLLLCSLS